jgi:2-polyprenyl-3-methyl-5-hydroxy-6-metoxy-1,4-benzoquinol methylase
VAGLDRRARQAEQMDAPDLDPAVYARVLHDLARVNRWTFAARPTVAFLDRAVGPATRLRLLDVGFGDGDVLRAIARWARRRGVAAELTGVDLNEKSVAAARAATPPELAIDYRAGDHRDQRGPFDVIVCNQVAHHMTDDELTAFLRHLEAEAGRGWLVCDLRRHRLAHRVFPVLARLLRVHRIVREDGRLSIARSLRRAEWETVLRGAGIALDDVRIVRRFPFRLSVERWRTP